MAKIIPMTVRLTEDMDKKLKDKASGLGLSKNGYIIVALNEKLNKK